MQSMQSGPKDIKHIPTTHQTALTLKSSVNCFCIACILHICNIAQSPIKVASKAICLTKQVEVINNAVYWGLFSLLLAF